MKSYKDIINDALMARIRELEIELKRLRDESSEDRVAASMLRRFLADKHPELTDELSKFVSGESHYRYYGKDESVNGALSAIGYHHDIIESDILDATVDALEAKRK